MLDLAYKFSRRIIPYWLYTILSKTPLRRTAAFDNNSAYEKIFLLYKSSLNINFNHCVVLEIGGGNQTYTASRFLEDGAKTVLLAEPRINKSTGVGDKRILLFNDINEIPEAYYSKIDIIVSHQVLEHVSQIDLLLKKMAQLLSAKGRSFNRVDLSDHTYHIFDKFSALKWMVKKYCLRHLKYSDSVFSILNDPKCFMNRTPLPAFRKLFKASGFTAEIINTSKSGSSRINNDIISRYEIDVNDPELCVTSFDVLLQKA